MVTLRHLFVRTRLLRRGAYCWHRRVAYQRRGAYRWRRGAYRWRIGRRGCGAYRCGRTLTWQYACCRRGCGSYKWARCCTTHVRTWSWRSIAYVVQLRSPFWVRPRHNSNAYIAIPSFSCMFRIAMLSNVSYNVRIPSNHAELLFCTVSRREIHISPIGASLNHHAVVPHVSRSSYAFPRVRVTTFFTTHASTSTLLILICVITN